MTLEMYSNGVVGCSYFTASNETLYLQEDTCATGLEFVELLLLQVQPSDIIIPSRSPESFIVYLERHSQNFETVLNDGEGCRYMLHIAESSDFNPDAGKDSLARFCGSQLDCRRMALFKTATEEAECTLQRGHRRNELMQLGTFVNLDSRIALGCANALLCHMEKRRAAASSVMTPSATIKEVQMVTYDNCMFVTADTMLALQIIRPDGRRNTQAKSTGRRDRVLKDQSVLELFNSLALTPQGHARLREMFLRPSTDLDVINTRHDIIDILCHPENESTVHSIRMALKNIRNIRTALLHLRRGTLHHGDQAYVKHNVWTAITSFCSNALDLFFLSEKASHGSHLIAQISCNVQGDAVSQIGLKISQTVDFSESQSSGCTVIAEGISPELDHLKIAYSDLQARLGLMCRSYGGGVLGGHRDQIVGCLFHPRMGYVTVIAPDSRTSSTEEDFWVGRRLIRHNWVEVLREDGLVFFKTPEMNELDQEFGDLVGQIIGIEVGILHDLASSVLEFEDILLVASRAIGELDCLMALAQGAKKYHLNRPQMTTANILHIRRGRHILQELCTDTFVPNDCDLAGGQGIDNYDEADKETHQPHQTPPGGMPLALVLTGPNQSGKSVYLKQVALVVYLAHVGSFIPAASAVMGVTDKILSRIATRESVSRDESAFAIDLRQAAFSTNFATRRSLVLIDEFGKGTNATDGPAILAGLLAHFLELGDSAPRVLAATHFHEILNSDALCYAGVKFASMDVGLNPTALQPDSHVNFLFKLRMGYSTESFGCHCAATNGVDMVVVERAQRIADLLTKGGRLDKICLSLPTAEIERLWDDETQAREFLASMEDETAARQKWKIAWNLLHSILPGTGK